MSCARWTTIYMANDDDDGVVVSCVVCKLSVRM